MKALSVLQPWAWALIHGPKRVENRTWRTSYRGPLLIHAGLSRRLFGRGLNLEAVGPERLFVPEAKVEALLPGLPPVEQLTFGSIVGLVQLVDVCRFEDVGADPFAEGPWCWLLERPQPLAKPIPWRGFPGLFDVPENVVAWYR